MTLVDLFSIDGLAILISDVLPESLCAISLAHFLRQYTELSWSKLEGCLECPYSDSLVVNLEPHTTAYISLIHRLRSLVKANTEFSIIILLILPEVAVCIVMMTLLRRRYA